MIQTQNYILDKTYNWFIPLYEGDNFFEKIGEYCGQPRRGELFLKVQEIITGQIKKVSSAEYQNVKLDHFFPQETTQKIIETWKWTGKSWKQC